MSTAIARVNAAIQDFKNGKIIILTDHPDRENEGDLVIPAEVVTEAQMNFMIRHGGGIVCIPMTAERLNELDLPLMISANHNTSRYSTPFTVSVDAKEGISTGVSAADRVKTIQVMMDTATTPNDLVRPGHVFPLKAQTGGIFARQGHTEGATDLASLAGFKPAAVISEIMNPDGTMAKGKQLDDFATTHQLTMLSIDDMIAYRLAHENMIAEETSATIPLEQYGTFELTVIKEKFTDVEHVIVRKEVKNTSQPLLVRIHSSCVTGDLFASNRCDCHKQFHYALHEISQQGGILIYLNQEGRGIGLFNKIKAYALQEQGFDTVEANKQLGLPVDSRQYHIAANILHQYNISHIRLMTNNPHKVADLEKYGINQVEQVCMPSFSNEHNQHYLHTKKTKLNHTIDFNLVQVSS